MSYVPRRGTRRRSRVTTLKSGCFLLLLLLLFLARFIFVRRNRSEAISIALFLQLGQLSSTDALHSCLDSLVNAQSSQLQLTMYLSATPAVATHPKTHSFLDKLPRDRVHFITVENEGFDLAPFLKQLSAAEDLPKHDYLLKMHSKSDTAWLERGVECLCGTANQVISVIRAFQSDSQIDIIAPMGLTFSPWTSREKLFPHLLRKYYETEQLAAAFDTETMAEMDTLCTLLGRDACPGFQKYLVTIVAGSMFWARNSEMFVKHLPDLKNAINDKFSKSYVPNGKIEHALERMIPSITRFKGKVISEIQPAPKPVALYFPQFHKFPENDKFWGDGFTEWTLLNRTKYGARVPMSFTDGGLGFYNLLDVEVRRRQAEIARKYGVYGFSYYHYWFSGKGAPPNHKVMFRVLEQMLADGEPNVPFMLTWANEPWMRTWSGVQSSGETMLIEQTYGDEDEWTEHFDYLSRFFRHPNYIRVRGKPVFAIYRTGHIAENLRPMLTLWKKLAAERGWDGIHIVDSINNFYLGNIDDAYDVQGIIDASYHFVLGSAASMDNLPSMSGGNGVQYWGSTVGFDKRPRTGDYDYPILRTPSEFGMAYTAMIERLSMLSGREIDVGFNFICAWNEWNEQAVLEPDDRWKFGFLEQISSALQKVPVKPVY